MNTTTRQRKSKELYRLRVRRIKGFQLQRTPKPKTVKSWEKLPMESSAMKRDPSKKLYHLL